MDHLMVAREVVGTVIMAPHSLQWIYVLAMIIAFLDSFSIGANDVANSFATAVGAGTLTLGQVCVIAFFTEFLGAIALGANTAKTIGGDIINMTKYNSRPDLLMFSMLCAMIGSTSWVILATKLAMPVSTTHSIVGAVIGVGVAAFGISAVNWSYDGIGKVLASFAISPAIAGVFACIIYLSTKYLILESPNAYKRALYTTPIYGMGTAALVMAFWVKKGTPSLKLDQKPIGVQLAIILGGTALAGLVGLFVIIPYFKRKEKQISEQEATRAEAERAAAAAEAAGVDGKGKNSNPDSVTLDVTVNGSQIGEESATQQVNPTWANNKKAFIKHWADKTILSGLNHEVREYRSDKMADAHARASKYEPKVERVFEWLQVFTSAMASFSHGANDVGNAIAPLASIYYIYQTGTVAAKGAPVETWMLAYGGLGINVGLLLYGYHIMRSLGNNMTYMSPSRGFSMELAAMVTVLTASYLGLPVSTTHCITGATAAVGLCNGDAKAINWKMVCICLFGWIFTLPFAGTVAGLICAFGANAPNFNPGFP
eukprot:comp22115_c0_seq1/m.32323 comp22115_c0_seq1/g.32323  ORF comp22115_c0_seq1/g.32323 comp22115_c0_seq1/m.32323 type:complete len:542 (-) comp22115_c0_seq1:288-1913(-)